MKKNLEDPNNHVPEISPDDDWDDLDVVSEKSRLGLPPRRVDRGLPPKKETKGLVVNRHESKFDRSESSPEDEEVERISPDTKSAARKTGKKAAKKTAKKAAKKSAKKTSGKTAKKAVKKESEKAVEKSTSKRPEKPSESGLEEGGEANTDDAPKSTDGAQKLLLPPAAPNRLGRVVHKIGTGDSSESDARPHVRLNATKTIKKGDVKPETSGEEIARQRRRFVRGERRDWGEEKGRDSAAWMLYTGLGVVALVVLAVVISQVGGRKKSRDTDRSFFSQLEPEEKKAPEESDDLEMLELLTNSQEEAKVSYAKYVTATSLEEFAELLLNAEELRPLLEKEWKPLGVRPGWKPDESTLWTVLEQDGARYGALEGTLPDFTDFTVFFQKQGDGLKLDWKATTGYSTADFSEMKTGEGDGSEVRARISLSDFYTFSLPDDRFHSYRVMSPNGESNLWGYTEIGTELDEKISKLFVQSQITGEVQTEVRVVLSMERGPSDSLPNQWIITDLVRMTWLDEKTK